MTWFRALTGFAERSPEQVRANLALDGGALKSLVNGRVLRCGELETPTLAELRDRARSAGAPVSGLAVRQIIADVRQLHTEISNAGALFQVASQFNLLEMVSPEVTPERGVGVYEHDKTQGPACAVAAGAGTIFRNYFAKVNGQLGQSATNQIDCLAELGAQWDNSANRLWEMKNGYALASPSGLLEISQRLRSADDRQLDRWRGSLRIGIQWNTQVTLNECQHTVSQAYCSALPVAYSSHASSQWADFARFILEASYEATLCAAIVNARATGNDRVFLTLLGGGAFGNEIAWILEGLERALKLHRRAGLDVAIVSYGSSDPHVGQLVDRSQDARLT